MMKQACRASARLRIVTYNLASENDGPQWWLGSSWDVDLHPFRRSLMRDGIGSVARGFASPLLGVARCEELMRPQPTPPAEATQDADAPPYTLPIICLQESIIPDFDNAGFRMAAAPGAVTHAGRTTLFVPAEAELKRHGCFLEAELQGPGETDNDVFETSTYRFPIAALLMPDAMSSDAEDTANRPFVRLVVGSVHLKPFGGNADDRRNQLERLGGRMRALADELGGAAGTSRVAGRRVVRTYYVVAGDYNMRDDERFPSVGVGIPGHVAPSTGAAEPLAFADVFEDLFSPADPAAAASRRHTWDTSTLYNGPPNPRYRSSYQARYDRVCCAAEPSAPVGVADWRLLGQDPFVCEAWDAIDQRLSESDAVDLEAEVEAQAALGEATDALPSITVVQRSGESYPFQRFASDHLGIVAELELMAPEAATVTTAAA